MATPIEQFLEAIKKELQSNQATEHSFRPALKALFEGVMPAVEAINEPKRRAYGAPDFVLRRDGLPLAHVEAKMVGSDLAAIVAESERPSPRTAEGKQLHRYRRALPNLLFTDGLVWYWFVGGTMRGDDPVTVGRWQGRTLSVLPGGPEGLAALLAQVAARPVTAIAQPRELAERLATIARWLHEVIETAYSEEGQRGTLHDQMAAFQQMLLDKFALGFYESFRSAL